MELIPRDELANLRRNSDQYRGNAPLISRLVQSGIKSPEDLDGVLNPVKQARELGLDLNGLLSSVRRPEPESNGQETGDKPLTMSALSTFMDEREARVKHQSAAESEDRMFRQLVSELAGDGASEDERGTAEDLAYGLLARHTKLYESGPLKGQIRPLSDQEFGQVSQTAKSRWKSVRGQRLEEVAANAGTARPAPPAPGGAGAATPSEQARPMPGTKEHRALVEARLEQLQARRSGAPLSQA
jgi:hypothetical protein